MPRPGAPRDRSASMLAGLGFLERYALGDECWAACAPDVLYMFFHLGTRSREGAFDARASALAARAADRWCDEHRALPAATSATDLLWWWAYGAYTATRLGRDTRALRAGLARAARALPASDFFGFDPRAEAPPDDLRHPCGCGAPGARARRCGRCGAPLALLDRYDAWQAVLVGAHIAEEVGIDVGCSVRDAVGWRDAMRPYPRVARRLSLHAELAFYAVTHLVYVLNDYSLHRLPPALLGPELALVREACGRGVAARDVEVMGEALDVLLALDVPEDDPLVARARERLLGLQNRDGSWGQRGDEPYIRFHKTWVALDGLTSYPPRRRARVRASALRRPR